MTAAAVVWECPSCLVDLFESGPCWCCGREFVPEINSRAEHPVEGSAQTGMEVEV